MKRQMLLKAADIVEKIPEGRFSMHSMNCCILGHTRYELGFEELNRLIDFYSPDPDAKKTWINGAAEFFGISVEQASALFNSHYDWTPNQAAAALRKEAGPAPKKRVRKTDAGVRSVKKAVKEALAVPVVVKTEKV